MCICLFNISIQQNPANLYRELIRISTLLLPAHLHPTRSYLREHEKRDELPLSTQWLLNWLLKVFANLQKRMITLNEFHRIIVSAPDATNYNEQKPQIKHAELNIELFWQAMQTLGDKFFKVIGDSITSSNGVGCFLAEGFVCLRVDKIFE